LYHSNAFGLQHREQAVGSYQMRRANDNEGVAGPVEQRLNPGQPITIAFDKQTLVHLRIIF
jgi:hypothetical protein